MDCMTLGPYSPWLSLKGFPDGKKPHECVRMKHAGGLGEGQTVKAVRNGEGGTKRGWKPATRNLSHWVTASQGLQWGS